jgi:hypothetical protein
VVDAYPRNERLKFTISVIRGARTGVKNGFQAGNQFHLSSVVTFPEKSVQKASHLRGAFS